MPTSPMDEKETIRGVINRSKDAVFEKHSRKFGVPSLRRMLLGHRLSGLVDMSKLVNGIWIQQCKHEIEDIFYLFVLLIVLLIF